MPQISQLHYEQAGQEARRAHDEELRLRGRMTNMKRTLLHSPAALRVYGEWFTLRDELRPVLGDRAIWILALAISKATQSRTGIAFMRRALIQGGDDPDNLQLSDAEALLERFGAAIAASPKQVPQEIWDRLKASYQEKTLVDLVAFAGIMIATNVFTDAVGTDLDEELLAYLVGAT
jgi:alkylhydroperoxidase family enzyme